MIYEVWGKIALDNDPDPRFSGYNVTKHLFYVSGDSEADAIINAQNKVETIMHKVPKKGTLFLEELRPRKDDEIITMLETNS